jgi:hypothetical protein
MTERETLAQYVQDEVVYCSTDGRHRVLSTMLKEINAFPKMSRDDKQVIITADGEVYTLSDQLKEVPDYSVFRALSASSYADDFVGPPRPLYRGELGEISTIRVVEFPWVPPVKAKPKKNPPHPKGPAKLWRRW